MQTLCTYWDSNRQALYVNAVFHVLTNLNEGEEKKKKRKEKYIVGCMFITLHHPYTTHVRFSVQVGVNKAQRSEENMAPWHMYEN